MSEYEHKKPPKTVAEIGIHISYIRKDLRDIQNILADAPSRREYDSFKAETKKELNEKTTRREFGVGIAVITVLLGVLTFVFNYVG